jgi:hypothetical protein
MPSSLLSTKPSENSSIMLDRDPQITNYAQAAQVIVNTHVSKYKTRTKEELIINEILKVLIEER